MSAAYNEGLKAFDLSGRNILVTGGGYGLGRTMAKGLAAAGAQVAVAGRTEAKLEQVVAEIEQSGGNAMHACFDATDKASCDRMVADVAAEFGQLHSAVVNHGVIEVATPHETTEEEWAKVINTNLTGCFYCARAVGQRMIEQGSGGSIVLVSSNGSLVAFEGLTAYGASKGGVDMMCRQMASEWGEYGIRVNTVNPGYTNNPMGGKYEIRTPPEFEAEVKKLTPLARRGDPEDFVGPVLFLCAYASSFVSGHILVVDGGYVAR